MMHYYVPQPYGEHVIFSVSRGWRTFCGVNEQARKCVSPCAFVQKKTSKLCHSWNGEALETHTSRLFLLDRKSGQKFLIDSGSEICVIPPSQTMNKSPQSNFSLFAANNTKIPAYALNNPHCRCKHQFKKHLIGISDLSNPSLISKSASHGTVHHIITIGPQSLPSLEGYTLNCDAVKRCKQALADAALLAHPSPSAPRMLFMWTPLS
ncbi:hypothetical protein TNCV_753331 [Trichonephila clavipes]|nr:hypothetical protein TNCV_753331 [Trichonephila clavipes]